jgi:hypothetical protein
LDHFHACRRRWREPHRLSLAGCRATLHEVRRLSSEIEFREQITEGNCINGGRLVVRPMDGRLWWCWHDAEGRADASAVLYRKEDPTG